MTTSRKDIDMQDTASRQARKAAARTGVRRKCRLHMVCEYPYRDPRGRELFVKTRFRHDPCLCGRGKSFAYKWETPWAKDRYGNTESIGRKPPDADWYLYRLDEIYPLIARGSPELIYWTEGEKDADELTRVYHVLATSHHQGAGKATVQQASWLRKAKHVVLVADLDNAGAHDVITRNNLLAEVGFSGELDIVRAAEGNDAADHIASGFRLHDFEPVDLPKLRAAGRQFAAYMKGNGNGYTS